MLLEQTADATYAPVRDLVAEANHRIANSLAAVAAIVSQRVQSIRRDGPHLAPAEVLHLLGEVRARVDAIARLHRALSDAPSDTPIDIGGYIQPIAAELVSTLADKGQVVLHFAGELGCRAAPERALPIGQIVVELVTNSIKYAHPTGVEGHINLFCRRDPGGIVIEVSDDGVGLPEHFDPANSKSYGLRLVRALTAQLGGTVTFANDGLGLRTVVTVPFAASV
jgi:two-component sensor histidine kinase